MIQLQYVTIDEAEQYAVPAGWDIRKVSFDNDKAHLLLEKNDTKTFGSFRDALKD